MRQWNPGGSAPGLMPAPGNGMEPWPGHAIRPGGRATMIFSCRIRHASVALAVALFLAVPPVATAQDAPAAPGRKPVVGEFYVQSPDPPAPAMVQSLRKHIDHLLREVYVKPEDLYRPPPEVSESFTLRPGHAPGGRARAGRERGGHDRGDRGPGRGREGRGHPRLERISLPPDEHARRRAPPWPWPGAGAARCWPPWSPGAGGMQLFDLRSCAPPRPASLPSGVRIRQAAMSDAGHWAGLHQRGRRAFRRSAPGAVHPGGRPGPGPGDDRVHPHAGRAGRGRRPGPGGGLCP